MIDKKIVWKMPDGTIAVTTLAKEIDFEKGAAKCKPEGATRMPDMEAKDLPSREFRNKWRADSDGKVFVDTSIPDLIFPPSIEERLSALEKK